MRCVDPWPQTHRPRFFLINYQERDHDAWQLISGTVPCTFQRRLWHTRGAYSRRFNRSYQEAFDREKMWANDGDVSSRIFHHRHSHHLVRHVHATRSRHSTTNYRVLFVAPRMDIVCSVTSIWTVRRIMDVARATGHIDPSSPTRCFIHRAPSAMGCVESSARLGAVPESCATLDTQNW